MTIRVLVADDHAVLRAGLRALLAKPVCSKQGHRRGSPPAAHGGEPSSPAASRPIQDAAPLDRGHIPRQTPR
jgi:hypothetical protein